MYVLCSIVFPADRNTDSATSKGKTAPYWKTEGIVGGLNDSCVATQLIAIEYFNSHSNDSLLKIWKSNEFQVEKIIRFLKNNDSFTRQSAVIAIGTVGKNVKDVVPIITELLKDKNPDVRGAAAIALGTMGEHAKDAVPIITELLKDKNPDVRGAAAIALATMGEHAKDAVPTITKLMKDKNCEFSNSALTTLGKMGEHAKDAVPAITNLLKDKNPNVRSSALTTLGIMGVHAKDAVPAIANLLKDKNPDIRNSAAIVLGEMGENAKSVIPALVALLEDDSPDIRQSTLNALQNIQEDSKNAYPESVSYSEADDWGENSDNVINTIPSVLLKNQDSHVRLSSVSYTFQRLKDTDPFIRRSAVDAVVELLKNENPLILDFTIKSFKNFGEYSIGVIPAIVELLKNEDHLVRCSALEAFRNMGESANDVVPVIADLLKDEDRYVRCSAAMTLGVLGAKNFASSVIELLQDEDLYVRNYASYALTEMGGNDLVTTCKILNLSVRYPKEIGRMRFTAHLIAGNNQQSHLFVNLVGKPCNFICLSNIESRIKALHILFAGWSICDSLNLPELKIEIEQRITDIANQCKGTEAEISCLKKLPAKFKKQSQLYPSIEKAIKKKQTFCSVLFAAKTVILHIVFWLILIFLYPYFPTIQAIFFWNPWVRRFTGLGYVSFLLTWLPFLRRRLFLPFKDSLLADAKLRQFSSGFYYAESEVRSKTPDFVLPFGQAIPLVRGQIILQGASGLGKTMFLRQMLAKSKKIAVYLPADKCAQGVMDAVQAKLHGIAQESSFLRNLIYSGAMDIYIDGLNEVSAETRAVISTFVEKYFRGNIILATQRLEWSPPANAHIFTLLPLKEDKIKEFLLSQDTNESYKEKVTTFLSTVFTDCEKDTTCAIYKTVLSNPMDLTIVSQMIAGGHTPDLGHLWEQQYAIMANDYSTLYNSQPFPLKDFSEMVYTLWDHGSHVIPAKGFEKELKCMERYKMIVRHKHSFESSHGEITQNIEWSFRHEKNRVYYVVQKFLNDTDKQKDHLGDTRYDGVYLLLAQLQPVEEAMKLERLLISYAAHTGNHTVSDSFVKILERRIAHPELERCCVRW